MKHHNIRRNLRITAVVVWILGSIVLASIVKDHALWRSWWKVVLISLPEVALPLLAYFDMVQSEETERLRADLESERNRQLQQIAKNTEKPITQADRNAALLQKHIGAKVAVSESAGSWSTAPEIAEVSDDNIVTLFTPRGFTTSEAWCAKVQCSEMEITDIPQGSCPLRIKVNRRYGSNVQLGEITKWEDRLHGVSSLPMVNGPIAFHASFSKQGSPEKRELRIFGSNDGTNLFKLESSTGKVSTGENVEISKQYLLAQVEYEAAGFNRTGSGTGPEATPFSFTSQQCESNFEAAFSVLIGLFKCEIL